MLDKDGIPRLRMVFEKDETHPSSIHYEEIIHGSLKRVYPHGLFGEAAPADGADPEELFEYYQQYLETLPYFCRCFSERDEFEQSFYLVSPLRSNAFKFFYEMLSRWLVPGKLLEVVLLYAVDFQMPDFSEQIFTMCELVIRVQDPQEKAILEGNLPSIGTEICLGVSSAFHAQRILEIKGLSSDEKTAMIQEHAAYVLRRRPKEFGYDLFTEMQHVLVMCRDEFKVARESQHISRVICTMYLFRKSLRKLIRKHPDKRHLTLKIHRARCMDQDGERSVLGLTVGVNFLRENELLQERHLMKAIQNYVPGVRSVDGSFFENGGRGEKISTLYVEIEKIDGAEFTQAELRRLQGQLPSDLKDRIEHLMHPVFMPRNEEEILRNILTLSQQIKYVRDIPQVIITFDEQTDSHLQFTVILVRVLLPGVRSIRELFLQSSSSLQYVHDQCKRVGMTRRKYFKEATVFRVRLAKPQFLRRDHSVDLTKARQFVCSELSEVVGEFRDYNGGMISKQNELLCSLRDSLGEVGKNNEFLLENFFYSLQPVVMRTVLEPVPLRTLFMMLVDILEERFFRSDALTYKVKEEPNYLFIMLASEDGGIRDSLQKAIAPMNIPSLELASISVNVSETPFVGYLYRSEDQEQKLRFRKAIERVLFPSSEKSSPQKEAADLSKLLSSSLVS